jgi:hypothetical protein
MGGFVVDVSRFCESTEKLILDFDIIKDDEYDAIALVIVLTEIRAFFFTSQRDPPCLLLVDWGESHERARYPAAVRARELGKGIDGFDRIGFSLCCNLEVDHLVDDDTSLVLEEVPLTSEIESDIWLSAEDLGFLSARFSQDIAKRLGIPVAEPKTIYVDRFGLYGKALHHQMAQWAYHRIFRADGLEDDNVVHPKSRFRNGDLLQTRSSNFAGLSLRFESLMVLFDSHKMLPWEFTFALIMLTASYGGVHLAAWHFNFPTTTEKWLWHSSCIYVASYAGSILLIDFLVRCMTRGERGEWRSKRGSHWWNIKVATAGADEDLCECAFCAVRKLVYLRDTWRIPLLRILEWLGIVSGALYLLLLTVGTPAYILARIFLLIESFISLRNVPIGVYAAVPWSNYIPHF